MLCVPRVYCAESRAVTSRVWKMRVQSVAPFHHSPLCPSGWPFPKGDGGLCKGAKPREEDKIKHPGERDGFLLGVPHTRLGDYAGPLL